MEPSTHIALRKIHWNKGKLVGQKAPLKWWRPKEDRLTKAKRELLLSLAKATGNESLGLLKRQRWFRRGRHD